MRPRQWAKNALVASAPGAAGVLLHAHVAARVGLAFVVFCLLASGGYLMNDVRDVDQDRLHARKRRRPVAAGDVTVRQAIILGSMLMSGGLILSTTVGTGLLELAAGYVALTTTYTLWWRRVAIADIVAIAGGFLLRAVAGGVAADVPVSRWFIIVVSFVALFLAAGKRYVELASCAPEDTRAALSDYNREFLGALLAVACAVALGAYCLWAFEHVSPHELPWRELTIVPFTMWLLRYGLLLTRGIGEAPEDVVFADRFLASVGLLWLLMFGVSVYAGR